jgi:glycosyltransferase involved in cell wall biosynthesis
MATGLDRRRFRPMVVLAEPGELAELLAAAGVEVLVRPLALLRRASRPAGSPRALAAQVARDRRELGRLGRERRVAIVHTNTSTILSGQAVARRAGAAHMLHVREIYDGAGSDAARRLWPLYRRHLARADAVACVSRAAAAQLDGRARSFVLHDALMRVPEAMPRDRARAQLGLPADRPVVAVVGRVSDWKGQHVLVRALAEPDLAASGAIGLVAGEPAPGQGHHEGRLRRLAAELGVSDRLRLLGFRDDVGTVFAAADVVCVPSVHPDAFPNSALEAAAAGVPVVAADCGGLPEIVRDGDTGRLVPRGDVRRLAQAVGELTADPAAAGALARAAAADVRRRFDPASMLDALQERYARLLAPA